jgi:hypothetical protein
MEPIPILTNGSNGRFALVNPENGDLKQLCKGAASNARWSPDRSAIGGDSDGDIVIQSSICENKMVLTKNVDQFGKRTGTSWAPRFVGEQVVYVHKVTSTVQVPNPQYIPGFPANTPQGMQTISKVLTDSQELMAVDAKITGSNPVKLTDFRRGGAGVQAFDIVGSTVCYVKVQLEPSKALGVHCSDWPTLSNERRLSDKAAYAVAVAPDGMKVLFVTEGNGRAIERASTVGGGAQFVTGCSNRLLGVVWSTDGARIAYGCEGGTDSGLFVSGTEGGDGRKVHPESQQPFDWR